VLGRDSFRLPVARLRVRAANGRMRRRPAAAIEKVRRRSARRRYLRRRLAEPPRRDPGGLRVAVERASTARAKENAPMDMARSEVRKLAAEDYSIAQHLSTPPGRRVSATTRIFLSWTWMPTTTRTNLTTRSSPTSKAR